VPDIFPVNFNEVAGMAISKLDAAQRKAIRDARKMIEEVAKADGNKAETRRRVERIFDSLMGYDVFMS
jgi:hypothetical protein